MYTVLFTDDTDTVRQLFVRLCDGPGIVFWKLKTASKHFRWLAATRAPFIC
jgi:hypothetical protein